MGVLLYKLWEVDWEMKSWLDALAGQGVKKTVNHQLGCVPAFA